MKFGRHKDRDWTKTFELNCDRTHRLLEMKPYPPTALARVNARLLLEASCRGPWRAIAWMIKEQLGSCWLHYGFCKWEWIRTRVFRLPHCEAIAMAERVKEEEEAIEELARSLRGGNE